MADYKIGDLIQHKCGDIGVVVRITASSVDTGEHMIWVIWLDSDGLDLEAWNHFPGELAMNCKKL